MSGEGLVEIRNGRLAKLATLRERGIDPYPSRSRRTTLAAPLLAAFDETLGQRVRVAGRLLSWRPQGAIAFGHVQDMTGRLQLFLRRETLENPPPGTLAWDDLSLLDVGDFVEASGTTMRTRRGEPSVLVDELRMLTKSLRPLPEKWVGLRDREAVLRQRYLYLTQNPEEMATLSCVGRMLFEARSFLVKRGFVEFLTPVLQPQYGGGLAKPFVTHVNALGSDVYLAISHELYLKRLIAAGYDKVFTIGRYFRNEGIDSTHHPEFSMIETMTAYENYEYNMDLVEELLTHVAREAFGRTVFEVADTEVDLAQRWRRVAMADVVQEVTGHDFRRFESAAQANAALAALGLPADAPSVGHALALAFEERVQQTLVQPTLLFGHPVEISPLAKPMDSDRRYAERFEIFIAGIECGDNWSEQNDPITLLEVWKAARATTRADGEHHPIDYDFIEVLEHGMPPTTGIGPGIERMAMLFSGKSNIDDVIPFPLMRPKLSDANRAVFGAEVSSPAAEAAIAAEETTIVLTLADVERLLAEGALTPVHGVVRAVPHVIAWTARDDGGRSVVTGHADVHGLLADTVVRIPGDVAIVDEKPDGAVELRRHADRFRADLGVLLRTHAASCRLAVEDGTHEMR